MILRRSTLKSSMTILRHCSWEISYQIKCLATKISPLSCLGLHARHFSNNSIRGIVWLLILFLMFLSRASLHVEAKFDNLQIIAKVCQGLQGLCGFYTYETINTFSENHIYLITSGFLRKTWYHKQIMLFKHKNIVENTFRLSYILLELQFSMLKL